jgi:hypothetical protein
MLPNRRDWLANTGTGLGLLALAAMAEPVRGAAAPKPKAKRIVHIYLNGGPSQVDTFDPKPMLTKYDGKPIPTGNIGTERKTGAALGSPFPFAKYGQSGLEISEIFAKTAAHADDLCLVRSMHCNTPSHEFSMRLMNCGDERLSRPSYGAWLTYALGSENKNLPGFVVLCPGLPVADVSNWRSAFLPGIYQGTHVDTRKTKVDDLLEHIRHPHRSADQERDQLDLLSALNQRHAAARPNDAALDARIKTFELAARMQTEASDAFDVTREPQKVREEYGDTIHGRQLLLARRLIERGVRVVQCYHGDVQPWDSHDNIAKGHRNLAGQIDGPIATFLADLKRRGLFDDTLVLIGGEFGRTPAVEISGGKPSNGRDHNNWGFSVVLAGGGIKGGMTYGATDDFGYKAVVDPVHVHDLHATMLHLMGIDHTQLTYRYAGRDFRLTDVSGNVVRAILA